MQSSITISRKVERLSGWLWGIPGFRSRAQEIALLTKEVLAEVEEQLSPDERRKKLAELAPELIEEMNAPKIHTHESPTSKGQKMAW